MYHFVRGRVNSDHIHSSQSYSLFRGKGHYVTCDSAYMGDIMALIACNVLLE